MTTDVVCLGCLSVKPEYQRRLTGSRIATEIAERRQRKAAPTSKLTGATALTLTKKERRSLWKAYRKHGEAREFLRGQKG